MCRQEIPPVDGTDALPNHRQRYVTRCEHGSPTATTTELDGTTDGQRLLAVTAPGLPTIST